MAYVYDPITCMCYEESKVKTKDSTICDKDLPAWRVSYISGYAGGGVNRTESDYFPTEKEANKRSDELKAKNIKGIKISKIDNFYHTKDAALQEIESKGPYMLTKSDSGRWGVLKNGVPLKYGMESEMRKYYAMVLKNNGYTTDSDFVIDEAISNCDASGQVHYLFWKDPDDGSIRVDNFSDLGRLRARAAELKRHDVTKMKEWAHAEWVDKSKFRETYNKIKASV